MYQATILKKSINFHEYQIECSNGVLCTLRASASEINDVLLVFEMVRSFGEKNPLAPFPFFIVAKDAGTLVSLCGPKISKNNLKNANEIITWRSILEGPADMVDQLFDPLLAVFCSAQKESLFNLTPRAFVENGLSR